MRMVVTPDDETIRAALNRFLEAALAGRVDPDAIVRGQVNRVPEPIQGNLVVFTEILRDRIETNITDNADAAFHGSIVGNQLSVDSIQIGEIRVGATVFGHGVKLNTVITSQVSGAPGGPGQYTVDITQQIADGTMASGAVGLRQPVSITFQVDVHGSEASDNTQILTTLMRDQYAVDRFAEVDPNVIPLYADTGRQVPFYNGENQVEDRYIVEILIQANQVIVIPQQFTDSIDLTVVSVEAEFPAS